MRIPIFGVTNRGDEPDENERLDPDRPHFPEASASAWSHSFPEAVLRIGLFADWFELRVGDNFVHEAQVVGRGRSSGRGVDDVNLGVKLAVGEQWR